METNVGGLLEIPEGREGSSGEITVYLNNGTCFFFFFF